MGFTSPQLAQASMITQAGGAASSTIGSYYSAASSKSALEAQAAALNGQAAIAETNARIAELGAQSALYQGERQVGAVTLKAGQLKSSQRTGMAANGIVLGAGSAAEIQASTDLMKEVDVNTITANAVSAAWGYRAQKTNYLNEAMMKRAGASSLSASASAVSPASAASTSLMSSASSVAGSWYKLNKPDAFNSPSTGAIGGATAGYSSGDLGSGLRF